MQGLILAAGMGKRLGKYTKDHTKCMVKVNGKTLIEYTLEALYEYGIRNTILVIGYKGENLKNFLGNSYKDMRIQYVVNENYENTNNIYSLWLAKNYLQNDDTILLESDVIFEKNIIGKMIKSSYKNLAVVSKYESWMDGTVTLVDENDNITSFIPKINFNWENVNNYYKTVNIYKFSKEFSKETYLPFLEAYIKVLGKNEYYEQVLRVISYLDGAGIKALKLSNEKWYEIDDLQDLDIASTIFSPAKNKIDMYKKRYGGYWRFNKLKDFCYLVNPYFPNRTLMNELKSNFEVLISQYPSGEDVQNLLASKLFACERDEILVGNGASELIKAALEILPGKVGIIAPTFNEYGERAGKDRVKTFIPSDKDFDYSISEIKDFSKDLSVLVLINPDNPSGHFFNKKEMKDLISYLNSINVKIIVDESFIDFSGEENEFSLVDSDILEKYKNLIVIKSISKSYGVPGIRLGVLASGEQDLIKSIRKHLSIWNINSFGEYFMQIIGKYKSSYKDACKKICSERDRFYNQLKDIKFLRVIPSKSNYFLCEVISKYTSRELTELLLSKYEVLIKDCSDKNGLEGKNYVRIAVKDFNDDNYIIEKLKEL